MTIDKVKEELNNYLGRNVTIKYNLGRNKVEKYNVVIKRLYDHVFIVQLNENPNLEIKSFSYTDVITKTIKIDF